MWTHAREGLDVTTIIFNNRSYAMLGMELNRVGATATGEAAWSLLSELVYEPPGRMSR